MAFLVWKHNKDIYLIDLFIVCSFQCSCFSLYAKSFLCYSGIWNSTGCLQKRDDSNCLHNKLFRINVSRTKISLYHYFKYYYVIWWNEMHKQKRRTKISNLQWLFASLKPRMAAIRSLILTYCIYSVTFKKYFI